MQYTKKPVTINAIKFLGTWDSLAEITGAFPDMVQDGMFLEEDKTTVPWFGIKTLEGTMRCSPNDYVIKGVKGEYYPCKPDIFEMSYTRTTLAITINHVPKEIEKALNALRLEVDASIVNSIFDIVSDSLKYVEITNWEGSIPLKMNGFPIGAWQMLSSRGNALVHPIFIPVGGSDIKAGSGQ